MSNCLICNNPLITLLELYHSTFAFNYCGGCFHCQIDSIKEYTEETDFSETTYNTSSDESHLSSIFNFSEKTLVVSSNFKNLHYNYDQILFQEFLDTNFQSKYKRIIFYKTFDKTREIKSFLKFSKSLLQNEQDSEIIIVTSTENVISSRKYTTLTSDIISYFCTNSMKTLCEQFGLAIRSIERGDDHSLYTLCYKKRDEIGCYNDVILQLYSEIENNLYDDKTYILFNLYGLYLRANVKKQLSQLNIKRINNLEKNGPHYIVGWGGNAKSLPYSINLLNFCELTSDYIDYFLSYESESNTPVSHGDIQFQNYWKLLSSENIDKIHGAYVTILNFTNIRINDCVYNSFVNLYGHNLTIMDIHNLN